MEYDLSGVWQADIGDGKLYPMTLPGTLDENRIGNRDTGSNQWHPDVALGNRSGEFEDNDTILTRFTRKYTWEGEARISKNIAITVPEGKRAFLEVERTRQLKVLVDGKEIPEFKEGSLAANYVYEVTDNLTGDNEITLLVSNHYEGWPHDDIVYSSMATDETQTNWNGVLGFIRVRMEEAVFVDEISVYPKDEKDFGIEKIIEAIIETDTGKETDLGRETDIETDIGKEADSGTGKLDIVVRISSEREYRGTMSICSEALEYPVSIPVHVQPGITEYQITDLEVAAGVECWDEEAGKLYDVKVKLSGFEEKKTTFGIRTFGQDQKGRLTLNGRRIFLRSEANCAVFPETGYSPMDQKSWEHILNVYRGYGVNCVRFHSHCPPEAAFTVADRMGMLMQPELSHWNPRDAFESEESFNYYRRELRSILRQLANHPSFVMLTLGNELKTGECGHARMTELLNLARDMDSTRLYANGSNVHYGEIGCDKNSDFYTSSSFYDQDLRGTFADMKGYINHSYPSASHNFDEAMKKLRKTYQKPVFSFEVGQYEILPDFHELELFGGITKADNLIAIKNRAEKRGLLQNWERQVEATGEMSRRAYREEVEAVLRTEGLSGISLLGLQDFPGQGTALVGMLNSHLEPKAYEFAKPEYFRKFFKSELPLVLLPKYTYENSEDLCADIKIANYGKSCIQGRVLVELSVLSKNNEDSKEAIKREEGNREEDNREIEQELQVQTMILPEVKVRQGSLGDAGSISFSLKNYTTPVQLQVKVSVEGNDCENSYGIWVYPEKIPVCPAEVYETRTIDEESERIIREGGILYISPDATLENLPGSIQTQFTTDFWSVGTFAGQEGGMGQLIDENHPIFDDFPTSFHTDWQWWPMASQRAVILPDHIDAIVTEMDSYATLRHMAQLFECRCGKAKVLFSTMNLQNLQQYPEGRALQNSVYRYLTSEKFDPRQEMEETVLRGLLGKS